MTKISKLKNSTLLKELSKRIKNKAIRFNYNNLYPPQKISSLISWDATDEYELDFEELEEYLEIKCWEIYTILKKQQTITKEI